jgi:hypothetical protein
MKNFISIFLLFVFSCATVTSVSEEFYPLHLRLLSQNNAIKTNAIDEFERLDNKTRQNILLKMIELLADEEAPDRRIKMLNTLQELKADYNVVIPLIHSVAKNKSIREYKEIIYFLMNIKPEKNLTDELVKLLKDKEWIVCYFASVSLVSNPKETEKAIPEMVETMSRYIDDKDKYFKLFDLLSMMNPELSILSLISDLKNKDPEVRRAIFEKLIELQVFLSSEIKVKKEILPALIRGLYDEDNNISKMVQDILKEINDPVAKEAIELYLNMGKTLFDSFAKLSGKNLQDFFKMQDERIAKRIKEIYKSIGREDALEE